MLGHSLLSGVRLPKSNAHCSHCHSLKRAPFSHRLCPSSQLHRWQGGRKHAVVGTLWAGRGRYVGAHRWSVRSTLPRPTTSRVIWTRGGVIHARINRSLRPSVVWRHTIRSQHGIQQCAHRVPRNISCQAASLHRTPTACIMGDCCLRTEARGPTYVLSADDLRCRVRAVFVPVRSDGVAGETATAELPAPVAPGQCPARMASRDGRPSAGTGRVRALALADCSTERLPHSKCTDRQSNRVVFLKPTGHGRSPSASRSFVRPPQTTPWARRRRARFRSAWRPSRASPTRRRAPQLPCALAGVMPS